MKNILLITTGGTISSIVSKEGLVPSNSQEILKEFGLHNLDIKLSVLDLMCKDSTNISPKDWVIIAKAIYNNLEKYDGIVVTHGTDTMAYTTSMLSYMLQNPSIPVVFTGSQLPISHPLTDGINNLHYAFAMASSGIPGIYMAFDRKIILGCRAVKVRTTGFHAFESINMKSVGTIDSKGLGISKLFKIPEKKEPILNTKYDDNIILIKLIPGLNPNIISSLIKTGIKGIVIEAFGIGGIPFEDNDFTRPIKEAINKKIPVVVTSQCLYEESDFSIYEVGNKVLELGVIPALDMTTEACVTKLMWVLGQTSDYNTIKNYFKQSIAGEINTKELWKT